MTKHSMASMLRSAFHNGQAAIAAFDEERDADWMMLVRQLGNIKTAETSKSYSSFKMADPKIGDDLFDAAMAAIWALVTRGADEVATVISTRVQTRGALMGNFQMVGMGA
jgi:hypothetical protein